MNIRDKTIENFKLEYNDVNRKGLGLIGVDQAPSFGDFFSYEKKENIGGII